MEIKLHPSKEEKESTEVEDDENGVLGTRFTSIQIGSVIGATVVAGAFFFS
jgi:hypothetical protein